MPPYRLLALSKLELQLIKDLLATAEPCEESSFHRYVDIWKKFENKINKKGDII